MVAITNDSMLWPMVRFVATLMYMVAVVVASTIMVTVAAAVVLMRGHSR